MKGSKRLEYLRRITELSTHYDMNQGLRTKFMVFVCTSNTDDIKEELMECARSLGIANFTLPTI